MGSYMLWTTIRSNVGVFVRVGALLAVVPFVQCKAVIKALEENALDNATIDASISSIGEGLSGAQASEGDTQAEQSARLDPSALTVGNGCLEIVSEPSVLSQLQLPATFTITWTYNNCRKIGVGTRNGTRVVQVTKDPNTQTRTMEETREFLTVNKLGASIDSNSVTTIVSQGAIADGEINRTLVASGSRQRTSSDGKAIYNFNHDLNLTSIKDTFSNGSLNLRVVSGTGTFRHAKAEREVTMTAKAVTYYPQLCCYPLGGEIEYKILQEDGTSKIDLRKFSSTCGQVEDRDGNKLTLLECPASN